MYGRCKPISIARASCQHFPRPTLIARTDLILRLPSIIYSPAAPPTPPPTFSQERFHERRRPNHQRRHLHLWARSRALSIIHPSIPFEVNDLRVDGVAVCARHGSVWRGDRLAG
jgi:hypothetical protein